MEISSITDNSITFAVPGDSIKNRICADYLEFISSIVYKLLHPSFEIDIISAEKPAITTQMQLQSKDNDISNANASSMNIVSLSSINKRYTFENFVVAAYNRMAHAAAVSVAGSPGYAYNPLFIHGASGLGKTHLMHAINNFILQQGRLKTFYLSCEHFVN
ncbi:MAG: chromosomal replication initiator protein DnaA, partial [Candidatus Kuenenia stuttgartiensis]|nr:chromosomal replication initiator protein DnaA [Candidatus Kuenenia stuttgartiensis]